MLLDFGEQLVRVDKFDVESCVLADRHYSRQTIGSNQFMPPGRTIVLRSPAGDVVFGWLWQEHRADNQVGFNCSIFRNESSRLSSDIILDAERTAVAAWGPNRAFTYINADAIRSRNPGYCFKMAGWREAGRSRKGLILLDKELS